MRSPLFIPVMEEKPLLAPAEDEEEEEEQGIHKKVSERSLLIGAEQAEAGRVTNKWSVY